MDPRTHRIVTIVSVVKKHGYAYGRFEDDPDHEVEVPFANKRSTTIFRGGVYFTRESAEIFINEGDVIVATVQPKSSGIMDCPVFEATCWTKKGIWDRQELMAELASTIG